MSDQKPSPNTSQSERIAQSCDDLDLPNEVQETANVLYTRIYEEDLYHGRALETVLAGTIYIACRSVGHACNPTQVAESLDTTREDLLSTSRHLMKRLNIQLQPIEPAPYIEDIADDLNLSDALREKAHDIVTVCRNAGLHSGKSPTGFAAGAIYAAATLLDESVTQQAISDACDVSTVTIRNRYQKQLDCYEASQT